jgi:histidine kinase
MLPSLKIPGYKLHEVICESASKLIIRAFSQQEQVSVILKVLKPNCPIESVARLQHEYRIAKHLFSKQHIAGVIKVHSLVKREDTSFLVLEDFAGISLDKIISSQPLDIVQCLSIAAQLAQILVLVHQCNIIHKDIKPSNIILNQRTGEVKLTDFGIASHQLIDQSKPISPNQLESSFAYISPEQTGRMNRVVDYRTDFYSLGVTVYEMLAGKLPFDSNDALELVHCHIAKQPPQLIADSAVAAVVMKLMAKNAEDRYQSATGLLADLQFCLTQLKTNGVISKFQPGLQDKAGQLSIGSKLYGREKEVDALLAAFSVVSNGGSEVILVSGYSGIGKSALVNQVHQPILRQRGYFITGKFEQFKRSIPLTAFFQAFESLVRIILTEDSKRLLQWRQKLETALGENGQLIVEVIPELELIIGKQPSVPQLSLNEAQNRFNLTFHAFIGVFAQKEHPLVIFLDDLQWADAASLNLIKLLIIDNYNQSLLIIGAYRDNEVYLQHDLIQCVQEIEEANKIVPLLTIKPLTLEHTIEMLCDALNTDKNKDIIELASLLLNKTAGNPFLLTQIIKTLHAEELIKYDIKYKCWKWSIEQIQTVGITDLTVVELMVRNLSKLPVETQHILILAACIGEHFKLTILSIVSEMSIEEVSKHLSTAIVQGLILPVNNGNLPKSLHLELEYRFLHDRVQQAAYSLINDGHHEMMHYQIGQLLLQNTKQENQIEENIFDIVNQLNLGISLIKDSTEASYLAELNLIAARKAKASIAFSAAAKYLQQSLELLPADSWHYAYNLTLRIYQQRAEVEFLNGNFDAAEVLIYTAIEKASSNLEKATLYNILVYQYTLQGRFENVLSSAQQGLNLLNIFLPIDECECVANKEFITAKHHLDKIGIEKIIDLPTIENEQIKIAIKLLINLEPLVYTASKFTLYTFIVSKAVNLSLKYGNVSESVKAYANFGLIIGSKLESYHTGYQLGLAAYKLSEKLNKKSQQAKASALLTGWIHCWSKHIKHATEINRIGYQVGLESGEFMFAGCNLFIMINNLFIQGLPLSLIEKEISVSYHAAAQIRHTMAIEGIIGIKFAVDDLTNIDNKSDKIFIENKYFTRSELVKQCHQKQSFWTLSAYYIYQIQALYLLNKFKIALNYINQVQQYLGAIFGFSVSSEYYFYYSLILASLYQQCDTQTQISYLKQIHQNQQQYKIWADSCPDNFLHKYLLVEAEIARISGKKWQALDLYDQAINLASRNEFIQIEALANELAALCCENHDKEDFAKIYMTKAYNCYDKWGAKVKLQQLEKSHPYLIDYPKEVKTAQHQFSLDVATVVKASLALSRELIPIRLCNKLLEIVRENAGAEKVYFIIKQNNQLIIESSLVGDKDDNTVWQRIPVTESYQLPVSLINYIERTQTHLVLDDASQSLEFNSDPYIIIIKPLSLLVLPIIHTGKLLGILYLENNLVKGAFTSERVELLQVIASQAAVSIENARFYATLEARVSERTQELETALEELNRTQLQLIQSEKMSGLGQLVAGIAHEINNPVSFIFGNLPHTQEYTGYLLELIKLYQAEHPNPSAKILNKIDEIELDFISEDLPQIIQSMHTGARRIKEIILSLRTFARLDEATFKEVDIHSSIESTLMILQQKLGNIQITRDYAELPKINCFAGEINQAILNILNNAIEALDASSSNSTISITTYLTQNNYIAIEITDNGIGISQDIINKIFDPFFTTKPVGQGTGLGLSICYQIIVDKHKGKLTCTSAPNQGSKFTILLPI